MSISIDDMYEEIDHLTDSFFGPLSDSFKETHELEKSVLSPRPRSLISDSISEILCDNFEEDQVYEERPNDQAWYWYTDLANYNSALYYHWSTKDVYELCKRPEFQFCDGSDILENSLDYWFLVREEANNNSTAVTTIFSPR